MRHFSLETTRLTLREIVEGDIDFVAEMLSDPDVMRFYPKRLSRDESMEWIAKQRMRYERDGHGLWLASERESGEPVGQIGLCMQDIADWEPRRNAEIGYLLHRAYWGRGFATEAATCVRQYAFDTLAYDHVISLIRPENEPSQAVARRLGMTIQGTTTAFHVWPHLVFGIARHPVRDAETQSIQERS